MGTHRRQAFDHAGGPSNIVIAQVLDSIRSFITSKLPPFDLLRSKKIGLLGAVLGEFSNRTSNIAKLDSIPALGQDAQPNITKCDGSTKGNKFVERQILFQKIFALANVV